MFRYHITIATREDGKRTIFRTSNRARVLERFAELRATFTEQYPEAWGMIATDEEATVGWLLAAHKVDKGLR